MAAPSANDLVAAIRDHGVPLRLYRGYDTRGRAWDADGSPGLTCVVNHHTATASATGSTGAPSLEWCVTATSRGAANMLIGRGRDDVWLITAGSAFHSGDGGPWPALGVPAANVLHLQAFGIEIDDPGVRIGSMTDTQVEMVGRVNAALIDLCGWGSDRIITHQCWTNGCHGVNPGGKSPWFGRKNDTLEGDGVGPYSAEFWRSNATRYVNGFGKVPEMVIIRLGVSRFRLIGGGDKMRAVSQGSVDVLVKAGVPLLVVSQAEWDQLHADLGVAA